MLVEVDEGGTFRTVGVQDIGLEHALEPWSDLAVTLSSNGLLHDLALYASDGAELVNAVYYSQGSVTAADRFVKGSALYIAANSPHYWMVEGVE